MQKFRCGTVALIGRPNVGKSTLLNEIVGQKIAIVSDKAQTTRRRMLGIATGENYQIIFVDTPGMHKPITQLGKILNQTAEATVPDVDVILVVVDSSTPPGKDDQEIAQMLEAAGIFKEPRQKPTLLCLNKMDLLKAENVEANVNGYSQLFHTEEQMLTSFRRKQNIEKLLQLIVKDLPEGDPIYSEDEVTDMPMRVLAAEIVREKVLHNTHHEVPYSVATITENWEEVDGLVKIDVAIVVERDSQKGIIIGKKGQMAKKVGTDARTEIEALLGKRVFLKLFVKVREDWRSNPRILKDLDLL